MGMRDFLDRIKKNAQDKLNKDESPEAQKQRKKDEMRKNFETLNKAINIAKKAHKVHGDVSKKVEGIKEGAAEKTISLADKAKPLADKIDSAADAISSRIGGKKPAAKKPVAEKPAAQDATPFKKIGGLFNAARGKVADGAKAVGKKAGGLKDGVTDALKGDGVKKPSTGSSLLDILAPAVPETEATQPKPAAPAPKKPRAPKKPK